MKPAKDKVGVRGKRKPPTRGTLLSFIFLFLSPKHYLHVCYVFADTEPPLNNNLFPIRNRSLSWYQRCMNLMKHRKSKMTSQLETT